MNIYPTAAEITAELRRAWAETVALLRGVPAEVAARKSFLWWASFEVNALINHTNGHFDQIRAALKA